MAAPLPLHPARAVLEALRRGDCSTEELMAATGWSRGGIAGAIWKLRQVGHVIPWQRETGRYRLAYDVEQPGLRTCAWLGCRTHLNRYNPGPYCAVHAAAAQRLACGQPIDQPDEPREGRHEQQVAVG